MQATGQTIEATASAAVGATTLSVAALASPLLPGTVLEFDGGDMPLAAEVRLTSIGKVGDTTLLVAALDTQVNAQAQAQDNGVNLALARLAIQACREGTRRVKLYCCARYNDSDLATTYSALQWSTCLAAQWLCRRRGLSPPKSIDQAAEEALAEMKQVQMGMLQVEDIGTRTSAWPFISNVTVDVGYTYRKVRVEPQISEGTPTQYAQAVDWNAVLASGWEW